MVRIALVALAACLAVAGAQAQARFTLVFKHQGGKAELRLDTIEECEDALQALGGPLAIIEVTPSAVERLSPHELFALQRTGATVRAGRPGAPCLFDMVHGSRCVHCWTMWMRQPVFRQPLAAPQPGDAGIPFGIAGRVAHLVLGYLAFDVLRALPWRPQITEPAQAALATLPTDMTPVGQLRRTTGQIAAAVYRWLADAQGLGPQGAVALAPGGGAAAPVPTPPTGPVERVGRLRIHHLPPAMAAGAQLDAAQAQVVQADAAQVDAAQADVAQADVVQADVVQADAAPADAALAQAGAAQVPAGVAQPALGLQGPPPVPSRRQPALDGHLPRPRLVIHLPPGSGGPGGAGSY